MIGNPFVREVFDKYLIINSLSDIKEVMHFSFSLLLYIQKIYNSIAYVLRDIKKIYIHDIVLKSCRTAFNMTFGLNFLIVIAMT
jgi:hypothetical protein